VLPTGDTGSPPDESGRRDTGRPSTTPDETYRDVISDEEETGVNRTPRGVAGHVDQVDRRSSTEHVLRTRRPMTTDTPERQDAVAPHRTIDEPGSDRLRGDV
jgi:hypothetical protein